VNVPSGTVNVSGAYNPATTTVNGGTLDFNAAASSIGTLNLSSGAVGGSGDLTVTTDFNQTGGSFTTAGNLDLTRAGDFSVGVFNNPGKTVTLRAPAGAILDGNGAATNVTADTLMLDAANGIALDTAVANLSATNTAAGGITLTNNGVLNLASLSQGGTDVTLTNAGTLTVTGSMNTGTGATSITTTGSSSDLVVSGGPAELRNVSGAFNISVGGSVFVTGGSAPGASALIFGDPDVNLTVGGNINLTSGSGAGAYARIQAASPTSIIISFTNPGGGQILVDNILFDPAAPGSGASGLFVGSLSTPVAATAANLQVSGGALPSSPPPPPASTVEPAVQTVTNTSIQEVPTADTAASQTISTPPPTDTLVTAATATTEESASDGEKKDDKTQKQAATGQPSASKTAKPKPQLCN